MSSLFRSFVDDYLRRTKLPADAPVADKAFHGRLNKHLQDFELDVAAVLPTLENIFARMTHLQHHEYSGRAWADHWKKVSMDGYDVVHNRPVDYGNVEYNILMGCMCRTSNYINACMCWFGSHYFPTLRPDAPWTKHSVEMHGDVFEILLAALRGHDDFANDGHAVLRQKLFVKLCSLCRTVQMLDAVIRTGRLKWCNDSVTKLERLRPDLVDHPFVQEWLRKPRMAIDLI